MGTFSDFQVVPPSVVATMAAVLEVVSPTAMQSDVDEHETELNAFSPDGTFGAVQVAPASVVVAI